MAKLLIVTNDFPPRAGGIQSFVHALALRLPPGQVVVYAPAWEGAAEFDQRQPFPVLRHPTSLMLPVPSVRRRAVQALAEHGCDTVLFGAAAPLGLLAPALRKAGARRIVALTHGHEAGWAALPVARSLLRRIGDSVDVVTYLGEYFRVRLARALSPRPRPGWPGWPRAWTTRRSTRARAGPRSGTGSAWPAAPWWSACPGWSSARARTPSSGPGRWSARPAIRSSCWSAAARTPGGCASSPPSSASRARSCSPGRCRTADLPAYYDAGDVFAMPCRTRRRGLDVEGLGIVYLEASATGLPVIAGDSGGAPDAVLDGETGYVVPGRDVAALAARLIRLLADPAGARAMGEKGLAWVDREWRWDLVARRLEQILDR